MLSWIIVLAVQAASLPPALPLLHVVPIERSCDRPDEADGDVIVCARNDARYRLPLPAERDTDSRDGLVRGEAPRATIEGNAPCGIFAGQRSCSKMEAVRYGYGGGRDPITVGAKAVSKLFDPDADLGDPAPVPRPRR
jgi:hypothetical protein